MTNEHDIEIVLCVDCTFLTANGDTPDDYSEDETAAYLEVIDRNTRGWHSILGHDHDTHRCSHQGTECDEDCNCEESTFSASMCGMCGTTLAGTRHDGVLAPNPYPGAADDRAARPARMSTWNGNDRVARHPD